MAWWPSTLSRQRHSSLSTRLRWVDSPVSRAILSRKGLASRRRLIRRTMAEPSSKSLKDSR